MPGQVETIDVGVVDNHDNLLTNEFGRLPLELVEELVMRAAMAIVTKKDKTTLRRDDVAYAMLASVSRDWRQTMIGWTESDTKYWFKHQVLRRLNMIYRPYMRRPRLLATLPEVDGARGVAYLDGRLYVTFDNSATIGVYDSTPPCRRLDSIEVEGLEMAADIAACETTRSLYIADPRKSCVRRVTPADGKSEIFAPSERAPEPIWAWAVSVTAGRVAVTTWNRVAVYNAEGYRVKQVDLMPRTEARHAIEVKEGRYLVLQVPLGGGDTGVQLSEFDEYGNVVRFFGGDRGTGDTQLSFPDRVALSSSGELFITDSFTNRRRLPDRQRKGIRRSE